MGAVSTSTTSTTTPTTTASRTTTSTYSAPPRQTATTITRSPNSHLSVSTSVSVSTTRVRSRTTTNRLSPSRLLSSRLPDRKRGRGNRKVKKVKGPRKLALRGGKAGRGRGKEGKNRIRKRLQFIRRVTPAPVRVIQPQQQDKKNQELNKKDDQGVRRQNSKVHTIKMDSVLSGEDKRFVLEEAANVIEAGNSLLASNSQGNARVVELTNNILELKRKLEQLKLELMI